MLFRRVGVTALFMRTSVYTPNPPLHSESSSPDILVSSISYTFQVTQQNLLRRIVGYVRGCRQEKTPCRICLELWMNYAPLALYEQENMT